ncbi:unnamed protein product [Cylicostephanus goldi]|uniref:Uncharacterized protein n=1 Tax=Cylicostephanus goldi TaxID=71465 RepID=A0A3P6RWE4_CYLGO|nr:unnamed protein product [Cylicostephanus goldi]
MSFRWVTLRSWCQKRHLVLPCWCGQLGLPLTVGRVQDCAKEDSAGEVYEHIKDYEKALECYKNGKDFSKAIQLARFCSPEQVVLLGENYGDYLVKIGQHEAAINHFLGELLFYPLQNMCLMRD